jgi:hypothetical protein
LPRFQKLLIVCRELRETCERSDAAGRDVVQDRNKLVPDSVADDGAIGVGGVFAPRLTCPAQVLPQFQAAGFEEWTDKSAAPNADARKPAGSGAAKQPQENRLGLIVLGVSGGDQIRAEAVGAFIEARVSRVARRDFQRDTPVAGKAGDIPSAHLDRHAETFCERPAEGFVCVGLRAPQAVIDVNQSSERGGKVRGHLAEDPGECDRVRPAGNGDGYTVRRTEQLPARNRAGNVRD